MGSLVPSHHASPVAGDRWLRAAILVALIATLARPAELKAENDPLVTVVGVAEADILACPRLECAVLGRIPHRAPIAVTGIPVNGFVPVRYGASAGYVAEASLGTADAAGPAFSLTEGQPGCDRVALIFNIGSGYEPATSILDTLEAERVPATMFVMGWWAEQNPVLLRRMVRAGFPIGSHGHLPPELTGRTDDDVAADLRTATVAIEQAAGEPPGPWFTPYAAAIDDRVRAIAAAQGYLSVGWTVRSEDWNPEVTAAEIYDRVLSGVHDGAIVELHLDASTSVVSTAVALPGIVRDLRAAGYRFVTIPEMARPCPPPLSIPPQPTPASATPTTR